MGLKYPLSSVQLLSCVQFFVNPWTAAHQASLTTTGTTPRAYSSSCPSRGWCHPTISSSVVPFSSCLQSFPASGSFPMSQFLISGGQSIGASASASVLSMNIQDWFPLGLTGLISYESLLQHHSSKVSTTFCHFPGNFTIPSFQSFLFEQRTVPGAFYSLPRN